MILGGWLLASPAKAGDVPSYEGLVNDYAQILSPAVEDQLEADLNATAEASDGAEIAVVTITSLNGDVVENVAQEFFDTWKIGKSHLDNGVLLLVVVEDKKLRIQTGYGAESVITDAETGRIIRNVITPEFKKDDYEAGIVQGVAAIQQQFISSPGFAPGINPINQNPALIESFTDTLSWVTSIVVFGIGLIYILAWFGRSKAWWPGGVVGLILGIIAGNMVVGIFFGLVGLVLDYILSKNYKQLKKAKKSTGWKNTWGGFSTGSSSRSSSGFGFGGGSSGSW